MNVSDEIPMNYPWMTREELAIRELCGIILKDLRYSNESKFFLGKSGYHINGKKYPEMKILETVGHRFANKHYYVYIVKSKYLKSKALVVSRQAYTPAEDETVLKELTLKEMI